MAAALFRAAAFLFMAAVLLFMAAVLGRGGAGGGG
jgi:hypothetical protein